MKENTNSIPSEDKTKPISLKSNVLVQELEKELLLYDLERNKAFCLNETSLIIWNLCDGQNTVEDIRRQVSLQLKTQVPEEIIWLALHDLKNEKLLSNSQEFKINFNGLTRREVIKKIGFTTIAALPLISTVISPTAAAAQSQATCPAADCLCEDLTCLMFGPVAVNQLTCESGCTAGGLNNCLCTGPFFCFGLNERFGSCRIV